MNILKTTLLLSMFLCSNIFANTTLIKEVNKVTQNSATTQIDMTQESEIDPYDLGIIVALVKSAAFKDHEKTQLQKVDEQIQEITSKISEDTPANFDYINYNKNLRFLTSKININSKYDNNLAVSRDMLKVVILKNNKAFADTVNNIIDGKKAYKNKKYFISLLDKQLLRLKKIDLSPFQKTYNKTIENQDQISLSYKDSFKNLQTQIKAHTLIFNYLKSHMNEYRPSNFIIDDLSLKYIIKKIDSVDVIKHISGLLDYYFNITIGKIAILIVIFIFFMFVNKNILPFATSFFQKKLSKDIPFLGVSILELIPNSFRLTLSFIVYIFALQISLFLLIEDIKLLNMLSPWFNTVYLALFSFMFYRILTNYINQSSDKIFSQYPNMRKEMVDFILRIIKMLILILVALFLLVQLGFDIKAIIASLGIGGIAVALAAKDTLSNFFGSLNIITDNSFSQGDWIEAGDVEGTVVDIRMRTTRIRTFANAMITIPNAQLANMPILNWSKRKIGRRIKMSLGITYNSKMSDIHNLVKDLRVMLLEHPQIATSKLKLDNEASKSYLLKKEDLLGVKNTLLVYIDEYDNSSINIMLYCFSRSPVWQEFLETKEDIIIKISELVEKNSCEFAFPTQTIHLEKED